MTIQGEQGALTRLLVIFLYVTFSFQLQTTVHHADFHRVQLEREMRAVMETYFLNAYGHAHTKIETTRLLKWIFPADAMDTSWSCPTVLGGWFIFLQGGWLSLDIMWITHLSNSQVCTHQLSWSYFRHYYYNLCIMYELNVTCVSYALDAVCMMHVCMCVSPWFSGSVLGD